MIKRDGSQISLWQRTVNDFNHPFATHSKEVYDVAIVGGGMTGIATALLLQLAGKRCIVLEAWNIGFGATGGTTAHLNTFLDTPYHRIINDFGIDNAKLVAKAATEALGLIQQQVGAYQINCGLERVPALVFSHGDKQTKELLQVYQGCKRVGLAVSFVDELPLKIPTYEIMQVDGQAKFNPLRYLQGIADAFEKAGGNIVQHAMVQNLNEGEIVDLYTTKGLFQARNVIYATHIPPGINALHLKCIPYRSYAMAVKVIDQYPQELIYDMQDPYHYIRTQMIDGELYLIIGGEDHKTAHEPNTEKPFRRLENYVHQHFDVTDIISRWSSQYYEPVDGLPYIGNLPGHKDNIYVATGFGGNGMTYSHVAAMIFRSMVLGEKSSYATLFTPHRIKPIAGFKNFVDHNTDVIKQFLGKWFVSEELSALADLAPGEGKIVRYNGAMIALSKDLQGKLHAVNPTCTHMRCSVLWNLAEQSWECPCHGARYTNDGRVLNGPAREHLEQLELRSMIEAVPEKEVPVEEKAPPK